MRIGASTYYSLITGQDIRSVVDELQKARFSTIELMFQNPVSKEAIADLKSRKLDYSMHGPFEGLSRMQMIEESLDAAIELECTHYVLHPDKMNKTSEQKEIRFQQFIKSLGALLGKYLGKGPQILVENMPHDSRVGGTITDLARIKQEVQGIGIVYDFGHGALTKQKLGHELQIYYFHLSDNLLEIDSHMSLGLGIIEWKSVIGRLTKPDVKNIIENTSSAECLRSREYLESIQQVPKDPFLGMKL
ncbi:MAG: sugar phosphate isomerase/epimerase family protein [Candidatus Woesearchaeota archaeon]